MALANYNDLKAAVATFLDRQDQTTNIVDYITLAEADLNAQLKLEQAASTLSTTMVQGNAALTFDTNTQIIRSIEYAVTGEESERIKYVAPENFSMVRRVGNGKPWFWTLRSGIEWNRVPDRAYAIKIEVYPRLNIASSTTNWLLTNFPQAYLAGAMLWAHGGPLADDQALVRWKGAYDMAISGARRYIASAAGRHEAETLHTDLPAFMLHDGYSVLTDE